MHIPPFSLYLTVRDSHKRKPHFFIACSLKYFNVQQFIVDFPRYEVCVCVAFSLSLFVCHSVHISIIRIVTCHTVNTHAYTLCVALIDIVYIYKHTQTICDESQTFYYASSNYSDVWQMLKVSESNRFHSFTLSLSLVLASSLIPHLTSISICVCVCLYLYCFVESQNWYSHKFTSQWEC